MRYLSKTYCVRCELRGERHALGAETLTAGGMASDLPNATAPFAHPTAQVIRGPGSMFHNLGIGARQHSLAHIEKKMKISLLHARQMSGSFTRKEKNNENERKKKAPQDTYCACE